MADSMAMLAIRMTTMTAWQMGGGQLSAVAMRPGETAMGWHRRACDPKSERRPEPADLDGDGVLNNVDMSAAANFIRRTMINDGWRRPATQTTITEWRSGRRQIAAPFNAAIITARRKSATAWTITATCVMMKASLNRHDGQADCVEHGRRIRRRGSMQRTTAR